MSVYNIDLEINGEKISTPITAVKLGELALRAQYFDLDFKEYITNLIVSKKILSEDLLGIRPNFFIQYEVMLDQDSPLILDIELSLLGMVAWVAFRDNTLINDFIVTAAIKEAERILGRK